MAKLTVLQMVKSILSDMESDDITVIADTAEALQVESILKDVYFQMVTNHLIPSHYSLDTLTNAATNSETFMLIPANVAKVEWIKYNKIKSGETRKAWGDVKYIEPAVFMNRSLSLDETDTTYVGTVVDPVETGITINVWKLKAPQYWTSFDNTYICFDGYDSAVDSGGLTAAKTITWARQIPTWTDATDAFVPDMDENLFPLLLAEAKSLAFINLKQMSNAKIDKQARQQRNSVQHDRFRTAQAEKASTYSSSKIAGRSRP